MASSFFSYYLYPFLFSTVKPGVPTLFYFASSGGEIRAKTLQTNKCDLFPDFLSLDFLSHRRFTIGGYFRRREAEESVERGGDGG